MGFFVTGISNLLHVLMVHNIAIEPQSAREFFVPLSGILPRFILPVSLTFAIICDRFFKKSKSPAMEIFTLGPLILLIIVFISNLIGKINTSSVLILKHQLLNRPQDMVAGLLGFVIIPFYIVKKETLCRSLTIGLFLTVTSSIVFSFSEGINSSLYVSAHIIKLFAFLSFASGIIYDTWQIRTIERERYELYNDLKKQKQFNENVLRSIGDGVYTTNTEKHIVTWSRGAEIISGYTASEVIGRKCSEFLKHRDCKGNVLCDTPHCPIIQVVEKRGTIGPVTVNFTTKFGIDRKIDVVAAPIIKESGELLNIVRYSGM